MTPPELDLEAIGARAKAATPGPWGVRPERPSRTAFVYPAEVFAADDTPHGKPVGGATSDASFIAHAREDVPALVAEVRRLREANADLRDQAREAERMRAFFGGKYPGTMTAYWAWRDGAGVAPTEAK